MPFTFTEQDVRIPFRHPLAVANEIDSGFGIVGTMVEPSLTDTEDVTQKRQNRVVVLLHGYAGHRDYIYQKMLAHRLATAHGLFVFRFDFRGFGYSQDVDGDNGHTAQAEMADIDVVMRYLYHERKLLIAGLVSHSRATQSTLNWMLQQQTLSAGIFVPSFVNCSGRFRVNMVLDYMDNSNPKWKTRETFPFQARRFGARKQIITTRQEMITISGYDMDLVKYLRPDVSMMTVHGNNDTIVPIADAEYYHKLIGPHRHTFKVIDGADHNYFLTTDESVVGGENTKGRPTAFAQVSDIITDYFSVEQENARFFKLHETLPTGKPRFLKSVPGVENLRDFGGFPVKERKNGARQWVKTGILFRSARLDKIPNPLDFAATGIKQVYDLRTNTEYTSSELYPEGVFKCPGVTVTPAALFSEVAYSPVALAKRWKKYAANAFEKTYSEILEAGAATWFKEMFLWLRDHPDEAMLFHCTAGKDRTGLFAMLVLLLLGVEEDTVAHEYELTTIGYAAERKRVTDLAEQAFSSGQVDPQFKDMNPRGLNNLLSSRYETMLATIGLLNRKYGGVHHFLENAVGLTRCDMQTIRENLLYDGEPVRVDRTWKPSL